MPLKTAEVLIRWRQEGQQDVVSANKQMGQSFTDLGNKAKAAGAVLTAGLTAPLVLIGKQAVDAASDLNEATSAVTTVFGSASDEMIRFTRTAASQLGQSKQAALGAAAALGALFKGVGLTEDQMADFSSSLLTASADLGSFYNIDPGQALQNLRSGLVGEAEPLRRFGILINEAAVEAKALELGLVGVDEELSEGVKVQARYALIMDQLGAAQGDFSRTSGGLANQQRILAARMQDVRAEIGTYLLPYALRLSGLFSQLLDRFQQLDESSRGLAVALGAVAAAAGPVLVIFGQMLPVLTKIVPLITGLISPLGLVIAAVVGLGVAFKENWFGIRDLVGNVVERIGNTIGRMIEFFQHARERGLTPFRLAFRTLIVTLGEQLGKDHPVVDFLQEVLRLGERLAGAFQTGGITAVVDELTRQVPRLQDWFSGQFDKAKTFGAQFLQEMVKSFQGVNWSVLTNIVSEGLSKSRDWLTDATSGANIFGAQLLQNLIKSLQGVNWDGLVAEVRRGIGAASERTNLSEEPGWQKMLDDLIVNTQKEFEALRNAGTWANDNFIAADWNVATRTLRDRGVILATELWRNTQGEFGQLKQAAQWVGDQLKGADWAALGVEQNNRGSAIGNAFVGGVTQALNLLGQFHEWVGNLLAKVDLTQAAADLQAKGGELITGVGEKSGGLLGGIMDKFLLVGQFFTNIGKSIIGAFPKDWGTMLYDKGVELIVGLWSGMIETWKDVEAWLAERDVAGKDRARGGLQPGTDPNEPAGSGRALGGPLSRRFTMVGEYGPELLINKQLVMPHGAAQSRMQAMGGMAYGGTVRDSGNLERWGEWLSSLNEPRNATWEQLRRWYYRQLRNAGATDIIRGIRRGDYQLTEEGEIFYGEGLGEGSRRSGRDRLPGEGRGWVSPEKRAFMRRMKAEGYSAREIDAMWADSEEGRGYRRDRHALLRQNREERRAERESRRSMDATNRTMATSDDAGGSGRRETRSRRESRGTTRVGSSGDQGNTYEITNYGQIKVYPPDANIGREIAETLASNRR